MPALVPHLRAFARTLGPDPDAADALVRDALMATPADWRPAADADELLARIEARMAGTMEDPSAEPAGT